MQKQKKLAGESSREGNKQGLRIAESPKRVAKLKLGLLLENHKEREMEQINEAVQQKLEQESPLTRQHNPYESSYLTDLAIWREYCDSTERYEHSGISLKWPYYFTNGSHVKP